MANNTAGKIKRPNAFGVIRKNASATVTQSPYIIPFFKLFKVGSSKIAPQGSWLSRW